MTPNIQDKELHRVVTVTFIYKPNFTYLIKKRAPHKFWGGKWEAVGGGLSVDDYIHTPPATSAGQWYGVIEKSLHREIFEETQLKIDKPEFWGDLVFVRPDGIPVICLRYLAQYVSGEVVLDEDATEFAWVTLEEAKEYDLIDGIWNELREVDELLKSRTQS